MGPEHRTFQAAVNTQAFTPNGMQGLGQRVAGSDIVLKDLSGCCVDIRLKMGLIRSMEPSQEALEVNQVRYDDA